MKKRYIKIPKFIFEDFLGKYIFCEFSEDEYMFDWIEEDGQWSRIEKEKGINEFCYKIMLDNNFCLKVYSSIAKNDGLARDKDEDAIRIVPAETLSMEPIRGRFPHIKRMVNWRFHFQERISEILVALGKDNKCKKCGSLMFLRCNKEKSRNFIGCSKYPDCKYKLNLGKIY